jgi:hypothetical protein
METIFVVSALRIGWNDWWGTGSDHSLDRDFRGLGIGLAHNIAIGLRRWTPRCREAGGVGGVCRLPGPLRSFSRWEKNILDTWTFLGEGGVDNLSGPPHTFLRSYILIFFLTSRISPAQGGELELPALVVSRNIPVRRNSHTDYL